MILSTELFLGALAIAAAIVALAVRDLLAAVAVLAGYSFFMAVLYTHLGAVDVGFTEAVVGAGVSGVLLVAAVFRMTRRSED